MNKIKYLIITLFITVLLYLNVSNGNEKQFSKYIIPVVGDINAIGRIIDTIKWPQVLDIVNRRDFENFYENLRRISHIRNIVIDGDDVEIANRENSEYIRLIYKSFKQEFKGNIVGMYKKEDNFERDYLNIINNRANGSLSNTLKEMILQANRDGNVLNSGNNDADNINKAANRIWIGHVMRSIKKRIFETHNQTKYLFVFLPPKLSANTENVEFFLNALLRTKRVLRLTEQNDEFLFSKTIMPTRNVYNILIDGHHTNHVNTAMNLVRETSEVAFANLNNIEDKFDRSIALSHYLDELGLVDRLREIVSNQNHDRNIGINNTCAAIEEYNNSVRDGKKITLKTVSVQTFEQSLFNGNIRIASDVFNGLQQENMVDVVQNNNIN